MKDFGGFPVLRGAQVEANNSAQVFEPGTIFAVRNSTTGFWSLAKYVQVTGGCSQGEVLVTNFATLSNDSVEKASTDDMYSRPFRGIAAATVTDEYFGFMYIGGYVEKADVSMTTASADFLSISGSTAGKLTPLQASPHVFAVARTAIATGVGSVSLIGLWG